MSSALSQDAERAILALLPKYPQKRAALIPALFIAQNELGHLPDDAQARVAELLELPGPQVKEVVTFYPMFHEKKVGRCHVVVCRTLSCAMRGGRTLVKKLEHEYQIKPGHVTADGALSFDTIECLASCGTAPAVQINDEFLENVDWPKLQKAIAGAQAGKK